MGLRIEISIIGSDSYVNQPTRLQSKQDDGSRLTITEVITYRTSTRGWIEMRHDLGRVRKRPLQMPPLLPSSGRGWERSLEQFQVLVVSDVGREQNEMRTF